MVKCFFGRGHNCYGIRGCRGRAAAVAPVHLAFKAPDASAVQRFHSAALLAGGQDHGAPGPRPAYGAAYYAAFVLDPDGPNVEAVMGGVG